MKEQAFIKLRELLKQHSVVFDQIENVLTFCTNNHFVSFSLISENTGEDPDSTHPVIHLDQLICVPEKIAALILSKLKSNNVIYARSCEVKKVDKYTATRFLDTFHIMNATQSAFNYGLYFKNDLVALASFSKGRKMDRLQEHQRSFELIRFCCKYGITVTGGLTRLIKTFCEEKKAGDIMTYIDKQLSDGGSFIKAGFKKHSETHPHYFLVDKRTFVRIPALEKTSYDKNKFYLSHNNGNIKLVFTPDDKV